MESGQASTRTPPPRTSNACLGCRRRKLKCSRENPCSNCTKAELPCIYDGPESGVKRKRGPYKKDKNTRERHLEDVNRYLNSAATGQDDRDCSPPRLTQRVRRISIDEACLANAEKPRRRDESADDLVKDAVNLLTAPSPADLVSRNGQDGVQYSSNWPTSLPSRDRLSFYFHIFQYRVDPVTKVLHWPTFTHQFYTRGFSSGLSSQQIILIHAVCYAALNACSDDEALHNLGSSRQDLANSHGKIVESAMAESTELPVVETVQALLLYMTALRRGSEDTGRWMFPLAVRMAQLMDLQRDPKNSIPPFQAEIRRRLWWTLCNLESRSAEEGAARNHSIMEECNVAFPANLNDGDLYPDMSEMPNSREGWTDIVLLRCRWEMTFATFEIWKHRTGSNPQKHERNEEQVKRRQQDVLDSVKARLREHFFRHLDPARWVDWLTMSAIEIMMIKAQILIDHPFGVFRDFLTEPEKRMTHLRRAVSIIERTTALQTDPRSAPFHWFYRNSTQWHALAVVITDLSKSNDENFSMTAWTALGPLLRFWEKLYEKRRNEPAWEHVNALLGEAKRRRQHQTQSSAKRSHDVVETDSHDGSHDGLQSASLPIGVGPATHNAPQETNDSVSSIRFDAPLSTFATGSQRSLVDGSEPLDKALPTDSDPFAGFDPQAFEEVFGVIDWDTIDLFLSE